ncbi:MAG TPA: hypothetical protein DCX28_08730, partial [Enterobacteriaceae bacterium]|nr:hypothetical protein [Enterobacteriaceae bacterium]
LAGLAMLLGVTAEISPLHARLLPASLIAAIFTLSLAGNMPIWEPLLIYALGTLWYGAFNWFWFWLWREQPLRESLSLLYRQLADYCEAKYSLLTQHADPEKALPPLLARQQKAVDLITQCYQQLHMLAANQHNDYKRLLRAFQVALDLQEHISVSLHQPEEVQKLVERSHAEAVIRWNAQVVAARLRVLADDILYHRYPTRFTMEKQIGALEKIARQHPQNPVGQFCAWHFSRIARVLRTQRPLYSRDLMADQQRRQPLWEALKSYLSLKSPALRNAARISVMLSIASLMGSALHLPKPYWILMTVLLVTQNGYGATRVRILHRAAGTLAGLTVAGATLHFHVPEGYTLLGMLFITLISYLIIRKSYGWATVGFTITAVYSIQILTLSGENFIVARLIDTLIGCLIAFGGMVWLWPQWQSGLLRKNAHDAIEKDQDAIRLILSDDPQPTPLAYQRIRVNQAHNALFNSLNQAMQEPGFNTHYLEDMKLWVTHSQFIVEHINALTTLAREHTMLTPDLTQRYLESCEIALQRCQQRLDYDGAGASGDANILEAPETLTQGPMSPMEMHLQRIIGHLNSMHTISSVAWRQRPHHGIWLNRRWSKD